MKSFPYLDEVTLGTWNCRSLFAKVTGKAKHGQVCNAVRRHGVMCITETRQSDARRCSLGALLPRDIRWHKSGIPTMKGGVALVFSKSFEDSFDSIETDVIVKGRVIAIRCRHATRGKLVIVGAYLDPAGPAERGVEIAAIGHSLEAHLDARCYVLVDLSFVEKEEIRFSLEARAFCEEDSIARSAATWRTHIGRLGFVELAQDLMTCRTGVALALTASTATTVLLMTSALNHMSRCSVNAETGLITHQLCSESALSCRLLPSAFLSGPTHTHRLRLVFSRFCPQLPMMPLLDCVCARSN